MLIGASDLAKGIHKLSALAVARASKPGSRLSDGGNLYLRISMEGVKSWVFMYSVGGSRKSRAKQHELGLGPLHTITLTDARSKAAEYRKMLIENKDPMAAKLERTHAKNRTITFAEAAERYIEKERVGWKKPKQASQWQNAFDKYVNPIMGR